MTSVHASSSMPSGRPLAIVLSGAGLYGGFIAGALSALMREYDVLSRARVVVATSASVGNLFYALSHGNTHPGEEIWCRQLAESAFITRDLFSSKGRHNSLLNLSFMTETVFRERFPFNESRIRHAPQHLYLPVLNADTRRVELFTNTPELPVDLSGRPATLHDLRPLDLYAVVRATNAAPVLYDRTIQLGAARLLDAGAREILSLDLSVLNGHDILLISAEEHNFLEEWFKYFAMGTLWPLLCLLTRRRRLPSWVYRWVALAPVRTRRQLARAERLAAGGRLLHVRPLGRLPRFAGHADVSIPLTANYQLGEQVVQQQRAELEGFLGTSAAARQAA